MNTQRKSDRFLNLVQDEARRAMAPRGTHKSKGNRSTDLK